MQRNSIHTQITTLLASIGIIVLCNACVDNPHFNVLTATREKISAASQITYNYSSEWDNRFNGSTFSSEAEVVYSRLDISDHGYGLHISSGESEYIYNGIELMEIDHSEPYVIEYPRSETQDDSAYFQNIIFFMHNPMELVSLDSFDSKEIKIVEGRSIINYLRRDTTTSAIDDSVIIISSTEYEIDMEDLDLLTIRTTTTSDGDTLQIIVHTFDDIKYSEEQADFKKYVTDQILSYPSVSEDDLDKELSAGQIQPETILEATVFTSIDSIPTDIVREGDKTIIMFSFIGCGGCEYAMKKMGERKFAFNEHLRFYYSSPFDSGDQLVRYTAKKGYEGVAFGKESGMNEAFGAWTFPTFFEVSPEGEILGVYYGYSDEVEELLFN